MRRVVLSIVILLAASAPLRAGVIGTYTFTLPSGSGVVMGDGNGTLSYTLTNTTSSGSETIDEIQIKFDPQIYFVSLATQAPAGWEVRYIRNGPGRAVIRYKAITGGIAPGQSLNFDIVLAGTDYGLIPADTNDLTDALVEAKIESREGQRGTYSGTPSTWTRYSLATVLSATPTSVGVGDNFTLLMAVSNRSTVTQTSVQPRTLTLTGTGNATQVSGPVPASATLDPGIEQIFTYNYQATSSGTVRFSGSAWNGTVNVTSPTEWSNDVIIRNFTAEIGLSSLQVTDGQQVTVTLTATNNGIGDLTGIEPHITSSGTATLALVSGPTPAGMGFLGPGGVASFNWVYTVTGNVGDTFQFTGWATSNTVTTNTADSIVGVISAYFAVVVPDTVVSGATGVSLTFTIFNNGGSTIRRVRIQTPSGWSYQSASAPTGWRINTSGSPILVLFRTRRRLYDIPAGGSESFTITFSSVSTVTSLTAYDFSIELIPRNGPEGLVGVVVNVTPYEIALSSAVPPSFPTPPIADGFQYYDITATLTNGGNPVQGAAMQFTSDLGALGSGSAVSDTLGRAVNTLTGPLSVTPVSATVTATYLGAENSIILPFQSYTGMSLDYVPGTLGPTVASPGDTGVVFAVKVINTGTSTVTLDGTSTFSFTDSTAGGSSAYTTTLGSSNPVNIAPGVQATLSFLAADVDAGFLAGDFYPSMVLTDGFTPGARPVSDPVTVSGGSGPVIIIRWKESIE